MRRPTFEQLADLSLAACANARRLYDDAALLRDAERLPSSFVLLGLAADELGKHILVVAFPTRDQSDDEWRKLWKRFNKHEEKLGNSLLGAWLYDPSFEADPPDAGAFHRQRLAATYVDFRKNVVELPAENIDTATLDQAFTSVGRLLTVTEGVVKGKTVEEVAASMRSARERTSRRAGTDAETQLQHLARLAHKVGLTHWDSNSGTQGPRSMSHDQ